MNSQAALQAWRALLPVSVCVSAGPFLKCSMPLTISERESAGTIGVGRMRELENGRMYAKRALAMIGIRAADLPIAPDRSPVWPTGVVGSITHVMGCVDGHVAAAVARTQDVCAIGIDVERENALHPRLWDYFLTEDELKRLIALPPRMRTTDAQVSWCAKEAVCKAARRSIEPTEIDIVRDSSDDGFVAMWRPKWSGVRPSEIWCGRIARLEGLIFSAVVRAAGHTTTPPHNI